MMTKVSGLLPCVQWVLRHLFTPNRLVLLGYGMLVLPATLLVTACDGKPEKTAATPRLVRTVTAPSPSQTNIFMQAGEIRPHDEVPLGFRLDGRLLTRTVDVGDTVTNGQLVGTLESKTPQNQLDSARADLDSAVAAERLASLTLKRMTQLMPSGAISRVQLDTARADWQAAVSRRQGSESALKTARENVEWTRLTAPTAGVVTQVNAQPGQVLSAGQTVVTLAVGSGRDAVIDVADPQVFSPHQGEFHIALTNDPMTQVTGTLRDISPQADPQTRTWRVRIRLNNPPPNMALGASVQVRLPVAGPAMIALPASALTRIDGKPAVFVVDKDTHVLALKSVTPGGYTANDILVSAGVAPGDIVVTAGVSKLRQGEAVISGEAKE